jgi:hypothetical protein
VQYLPVREYVAWSPRVGGRGYEFATSFSMPLEELINALVPQFSGILDHYWGRNGIHLHSEYAGAAVIVLATAAVGGQWLRGVRRFWSVVFIVSLLWALGGSTPFYRIVYALVPGTKFFRAPSTMMYVSMFSVAVLAAIGVEKVLARRVGSRFVIGWAVAGGVVALLGTSGGLTNLARTIAVAARGPQIDDFVRSNGPSLVFGTLRSVMVVAVTVGVIWLIGRERLAPRIAAWTLAVLVALDLWSIERMYWMFSPPAATVFASDAAIEAIKAAPEPGRVVTADFLGAALQNSDPIFVGDGLMVHRVRTLLGYHGNELGRYEHVLDKPAPDMRYPEEIQFDPGVWRHENVQYLYTTLPDSLAGALQAQAHFTGELTKVVGPVRNAAGSTVYLYKFPGRNPPSWVASAMVKAEDEQARATVRDIRFDPARVAIVDSAASIPTVQIQSLPEPARVQATVRAYEPGAIDVLLDQPAAAGQPLVVSENYFPGWRATADGKAAPVARMNYNLIGVALPAGARTIQLRFTDAAYETGKVVTLVAVTLAVLLGLWGTAAERRRRVVISLPA